MSDLRAQLKKALDRVDKDIKGAITAAAEGIGEGMVIESRVVTGLWAGSWQTSINEPHEETLLPLDIDGGQQISTEEALDVAQNIPEFSLGDTIYWSNSIPYRESFDWFSDRRAGKDTGMMIAQENVDGYRGE